MTIRIQPLRKGLIRTFPAAVVAVEVVHSARFLRRLAQGLAGAAGCHAMLRQFATLTMLSMNTPNPVPSPAQAARALLKQLQADFPVFRQAKPLSIGIDKQLIGKLPDVNRKILRIALGMHTNSTRYLKAMEKAAERYNLEGNVDGEVSETHRTHAAEVLRERQKKEAEQRRVERAAQQAEQARRQSEEKLHQLAAKFSRSR